MDNSRNKPLPHKYSYFVFGLAGTYVGLYGSGLFNFVPALVKMVCHSINRLQTYCSRYFIPICDKMCDTFAYNTTSRSEVNRSAVSYYVLKLKLCTCKVFSCTCTEFLCTCTVLMYMYSVLVYMQCSHVHIQCSRVHVVFSCTCSVLVYMQCSHVHVQCSRVHVVFLCTCTVFSCTYSVLVYTQCPCVYLVFTVFYLNRQICEIFLFGILHHFYNQKV